MTSQNRMQRTTTSSTYEILYSVEAATGDKPTYLNTSSCCRFCLTKDPNHFKHESHTFPQAFGNHWIISLDECDNCNNKFSIYENSLASLLGTFLTIGGTTGAKNRVRQTGRSNSNAFIKHRVENARRHLRSSYNNVDVNWKEHDNKLTGSFPVPHEKFNPRLAYKALSKIGYSLLPQDEIQKYSQLREWLLDVRDDVDFPVLEARISFGGLGMHLPYVQGVLLRRLGPDVNAPYIVLVFVSGSICVAIDLRSDSMENGLSHSIIGRSGTLTLNWRQRFRQTAESTDEIVVDYTDPIYLNLSSTENHKLSDVFSSLTIDVEQHNGHSRIAPNQSNSDIVIKDDFLRNILRIQFDI